MRGRVIKVAIIFIGLAFGLGYVVFSAAESAMEREETLHAIGITSELVEKYFERTGRWPWSWEDLLEIEAQTYSAYRWPDDLDLLKKPFGLISASPQSTYPKSTQLPSMRSVPDMQVIPPGRRTFVDSCSLAKQRSFAIARWTAPGIDEVNGVLFGRVRNVSLARFGHLALHTGVDRRVRQSA